MKDFLKKAGRFLLYQVKRLSIYILIFTVIKVPWFWYYYPQGELAALNLDTRDTMARRDYLLRRVSQPDFGMEDMPFFIPDQFREEWLIGTLSMTSAALANIAFDYPETRAGSLEAVGMMIERFLQPDVRAFEVRHWNEDALDTLDGNNGHIGYLGHLNFMIGTYRYLGGDGRYGALGRDISRALARRIMASRSGYLETFPGYIFVPDNMVVYASLALSEALTKEELRSIVERWRDYTTKHLIDPRTKLIYSWVTDDGQGVGPARGSYVGWNSFYLGFFAPEFGEQQFQGIRDHMIVKLPFGGRAVREYPEGYNGYGDIDSGPVVFGMSTSGTGFALAAAKLAGDKELVHGLLMTAEFAGFTSEWAGKRRYLLAPLVGDAIMLAMKTARIWNDKYIVREV